MPDPSERRLPVGRVAGHRGRHGEITVRVSGGDARFWSGVREVWIEAGPAGPDEIRAVRAARAYRDRLVLRLAGVEDASAAAALRGRRVSVPASAAPRPAAGKHFRAALVGMEVRDRRGRIGRVADWLITAGRDIVMIRTDADPAAEPREILVPWVEEIVESVDEERGVIRIRPPEGLLDLDREDEE